MPSATTSSSSSSGTSAPSPSNAFPRRVKVKEVLLSRYQVRGDERYTSGKKPLSWDERIAGIDEILTEAGERLKLFSNGGQSTPAPGWELLLTGFAPESEVAIAPIPAEPLVIQRLSTAAHYGDVTNPSADNTLHVHNALCPMTWTLYGIAKAV